MWYSPVQCYSNKSETTAKTSRTFVLMSAEVIEEDNMHYYAYNYPSDSFVVHLTKDSYYVI